MKSYLDILKNGQKKLAILIDPDKTNSANKLEELTQKIQLLSPDFIFIGGSTVGVEDFHTCINQLKEKTEIPIIIFPGSSNQISAKADGILFLSLISGRNPDFLIGHQIESAHQLKKMDLQVLPTGYILIDGGKTSSVAYVSQTTPIPSDQINIAVKTAIAGEFLGLQTIFMDAGSGAKDPISAEMISAVKKSIQVPLIIGGGIQTIQQIESAYNAGADLVVVGNKIEQDIDFLLDMKILLEKK
jgi:phosphoglycerol geranylgeranyltransferase